jgi:Phage integrase, N-terminal SAM-like domain
VRLEYSEEERAAARRGRDSPGSASPRALRKAGNDPLSRERSGQAGADVAVSCVCAWNRCWKFASRRASVLPQVRSPEDARAEVMRRVRRGERVTPIRATFGEFSQEWLDSQTQLRPATKARYEWALKRHLRPRFARFKLAEVREDQIAALVADMQRAGYAGSTIRAVLAPSR